MARNTLRVDGSLLIRRDDSIHLPEIPFPTGTITFMCTDIEDSRQLWEQHPHAIAFLSKQ